MLRKEEHLQTLARSEENIATLGPLTPANVFVMQCRCLTDRPVRFSLCLNVSVTGGRQCNTEQMHIGLYVEPHSDWPIQITKLRSPVVCTLDNYIGYIQST